jgi:hypothetical protein
LPSALAPTRAALGPPSALASAAVLAESEFIFDGTGELHHEFSISQLYGVYLRLGVRSLSLE